MKYRFLLAFVIGFIMVLGACSNNESTSEDKSADSGEMNDASTEQTAKENSKVEWTTSDSKNQDQTKATPANKESSFSSQDSSRKIIYNANLSVEVKDFEVSVNDIQAQITEAGGYIVNSSTNGGADGKRLYGQVTARIPQERFRNFLKTVEKESMKVLESNVTGEDVTEEYVDLESRLKSKKVVEKRLLDFMEKAEKTEDLLKISADLANVQEEIEQITGRMNYLQNKADLATVTINISENKINVPKIEEENLNTWERTKKLFMESVNFLLSTLSGLFVFIVGSLPVLLLLGLIGFVSFRIYKKKKNKDQG
ncbi:DUF4349 domain-containing protein [Terrihalobacillus insolitus]|uniref:DUF4349 domain-containing protein n=1 Tax=Terrihalobacillus insolitus TaxID=2950438 RepID=UPI00233FCC38|nr:DUF4349 domain-containing protein [Terrihalobacillus insolitus]MDC3413218.1 DUF4349 domain-containing protein [Terrihalobacillus insolitus]